MQNLAEMIGANQLFRYLTTGIALAIMWALGGDACLGDILATTEAPTNVKVPTYLVKTSANNRYLVDQNNVPFMIVGDSPQSLIGRMSNSDATLYMANRQRYGINTLWVNFLCNDKTACNADGTTFDGIPPFTTPGDIATPNHAYFDRAAEMLKIAAAHGVTIMLNVIETIGWLDIFRANGPEKAEAFGRYVGNQYRDIPNIIWMYGNDFQTWADLSDDALVLAVAKGIMSADHNHIHTTELNYLSSGSLDDARWDRIANIDGVYTYYPTYAQILKEYNRPNFKPVFTVEANYEFEQNYADRGSPENLRRQEYWTMLSGATGQLYGSAFTWRLPSGWLSNWRLSLSAGRLFGWRSNLDTPGVIQLSYMKSLFAARRWYDRTISYPTRITPR